MYQISLSQEDMNIVMRGLSLMPLGDAMSTFQRVAKQIQQQQTPPVPPEKTTNGVEQSTRD